MNHLTMMSGLSLNTSVQCNEYIHVLLMRNNTSAIYGSLKCVRAHLRIIDISY